ncbi:MAG: LLM class flavin-dependent oxidoreductase [Acidimicrobiia bacterium]|nr:LLM class flavin-dependent oxidoreductase [Acidimicrobiia bacterium]
MSARMSGRMRIGLTLPSFVQDPEIALSAARIAEECGIDGVFVYDHVFRRGRDGERRPAIEAISLLGAIAEATTQVSIGTLVLRASLRPAASTAAAVATAARIAPGRVIAGVGAGDSESREENESFGLGFGSVSERVMELEETVRVVRDQGAPVWVGGLAPSVRGLAAREADGWNAWGVGPATFLEWARAMRPEAVRSPFECTWSGLVVLDETDAAATERAAQMHASSDTIVGNPATVAGALAELADGGADWAILGAVDAADPRTVRLLGESVMPLLARR